MTYHKNKRVFLNAIGQLLIYHREEKRAMQIVIDISEHLYKCLKKRIELGVNTELDLIVAKGKLLPRHGRLIDADKLPVCAKLITLDGTSVYIPAVPILKIVNAPTIIEADKAESEE